MTNWLSTTINTTKLNTWHLTPRLWVPQELERKIFMVQQLSIFHGRPTTAEYPQGRLLGEPKATRAVMQFLASTSIALPQGHLQQAVERAQNIDE